MDKMVVYHVTEFDKNPLKNNGEMVKTLTCGRVCKLPVSVSVSSAEKVISARKPLSASRENNHDLPTLITYK